MTIPFLRSGHTGSVGGVENSANLLPSLKGLPR